MLKQVANLLFGWWTKRFDALVDAINSHNQSIIKMSIQLDTLIAQVAQTVAVETSAVALIQDLADKLATLADDPQAILALSDQLKMSADILAAAIAANTPADPTGTV